MNSALGDSWKLTDNITDILDKTSKITVLFNTLTLNCSITVSNAIIFFLYRVGLSSLVV